MEKKSNDMSRDAKVHSERINAVRDWMNDDESFFFLSSFCIWSKRYCCKYDIHLHFFLALFVGMRFICVCESVSQCLLTNQQRRYMICALFFRLFLRHSTRLLPSLSKHVNTASDPHIIFHCDFCDVAQTHALRHRHRQILELFYIISNPFHLISFHFFFFRSSSSSLLLPFSF